MDELAKLFEERMQMRLEMGFAGNGSRRVSDFGMPQRPQGDGFGRQSSYGAPRDSGYGSRDNGYGARDNGYGASRDSGYGNRPSQQDNGYGSRGPQQDSGWGNRQSGGGDQGGRGGWGSNDNATSNNSGWGQGASSNNNDEPGGWGQSASSNNNNNDDSAWGNVSSLRILPKADISLVVAATTLLLTSAAWVTAAPTSPVATGASSAARKVTWYVVSSYLIPFLYIHLAGAAPPSLLLALELHSDSSEPRVPRWNHLLQLWQGRSHCKCT